MQFTPENLIAKFITDIDAGEATSRAYANALRQMVRFIKHQEKKEFSKENIIAFRERLKAEGKRAATIQLYIVAARKFFSWLAEKKLIKETLAGVKNIKIDSTQFVKGHLTSDQARTLLNSINRNSLVGKRDYALIALMLTSGIRTIEAARANIADIITIGEDRALMIQRKGHQAKDNYIKLPNVVMMALQSYLDARKASDPYKALFISFSRRGSSRLTTRSISRIVKQRLNAIGINSRLLTAHSLRHTAATENLLAGGTLQETQQLLGHKNINTTLRYAHAIERKNNRSEQRIADKIFS